MSLSIYLNETLQVTVDAAATTTESPLICAWADVGGSVGNQKELTTGTTAVVACYGPTTPGVISRVISSFSVFNADTVQHTYTIAQTDSSSNVYGSAKVTLPVGYTLMYENGAGWRVTDTSGNFRETVFAYQAGTWTVAISGTVPVTQSGSWTVAATQSGTWNVGITGNVTVVPGTGTWSVNLAQMNGVALASPTAYGTAPTGNVQGVNAYVTALPSLPAGSNAIGSVSVSNFPTTQNINLAQMNGSALGAPSNYGTSPGAVAVQGVNAFVTNTLTVNTHAVTQASGPWTFNLTQVGGTSLALGSNVSASSVPVVIASDQATLPTAIALGIGIRSDLVSSATPVNTMSSARTKVYGISVYANNVILAAGTVNLFLKDGSGNQIIGLTLPTGISTALNGLLVSALGSINQTMVNGSNSPTYSLSASLTSGNFIVVVQFM